MNAIVYNGEKNRAISKDSIVLDDNMYSKRSKYKSSEKTIQVLKKYEKKDCCERVLTEGVSHATAVTKRLWNYSLIDLGITTTKDTNI